MLKFFSTKLFVWNVFYVSINRVKLCQPNIGIHTNHYSFLIWITATAKDTTKLFIFGRIIYAVTIGSESKTTAAAATKGK